MAHVHITTAQGDTFIMFNLPAQIDELLVGVLENGADYAYAVKSGDTVTKCAELHTPLADWERELLGLNDVTCNACGDVCDVEESVWCDCGYRLDNA